MISFKNRQQAGEFLASRLKIYRGIKNGVVLGIPRGGVVVAKEVADKLGLPLNVIVVRKIGAPMNPELAIGAVAEKGVVVWNENLCRQLNVEEACREEIVEKKKEEVAERVKNFKKENLKDLKGKIVIIVDDGAATGETALAAIKSVKKMGAGKIILALPVIALDTLEKLKKETDEIVYLISPSYFYAVGQFYEDFPQVGDGEVKNYL